MSDDGRSASPDIGRTGAIVLAGGRSARFGTDKLEARIGDRSLLDLAITAVQAVVTDVVVCTSPDGTPDVPTSVRVANDATPYDGPLAGVATGLAAMPAGVDRFLVVGADMPSLEPAVLRELLAQIGDGAEAACLVGPDGRTRPLPSAYRRDPAAQAVATLLASGERRLRALTANLATTAIPDAAWRSLDPTGGTLRDIDTPADIALD